MNDYMDIINSLNHRMSLLHKTNEELINDNRENEWATDKLNQKITSELSLLKEETKYILNECKDIHKAVFQLGLKLREKVPKQELNLFETTVNEWNLEDFITKPELPITFEKYSTFQH